MRVGARLKALRKQKKITLQALAAASGLSAAYLSNLERDATSPTLVNLSKICDTLGVSLTVLLHEASTKAVVRRDERLESFRVSPGVRCELMTRGNRQMKAVCMTIDAQHFEEEISWGHASDEFCVVVRGSMTVTLAGEVHELEHGDSIYVSKGIPHRFRKTCPDECVSYWIMRDAEDYYAAEALGQGSHV